MTYLEINLYCLVLLIIILYVLPIKKHSKENIILFFTFTSVIFFNIFKDWRNMPDIVYYVPTFEYISQNNSTFEYANAYYYKMQIGYYWLNKTISYVSTSHYWFLFAMGSLISLPYAYMIRKYSPTVWLSCLIYFMGFSQSTYVLRQHSAIGITIMTLPLILSIKGEQIKDVFKKTNFVRITEIVSLIAIAILIHPTAVIFISVLWAYYCKNIKLFLFSILCGGAILYFMLPLLTLMFIENTSGYDIYLDAENNNNGGTLLVNGFYFIASLLFLRPYAKLSPLWLLLFKVQCIIFAFTIVSMAPGGGATIPRLLMYLTCFNCIFNAYVATRMPNKAFRWGYICVILFFAYYMFALSTRVQFQNYNIDI